MNRFRYDRRHVLNAVDAIVERLGPGPGIVAIPPTFDTASILQVRLQRQILEECLYGRPADLTFSPLDPVTESTPPTDMRRLLLTIGEAALENTGAELSYSLATGRDVTAYQFLIRPHSSSVHVNMGLRGYFWSYRHWSESVLSLNWPCSFGWELPSEDRGHVTHITVLRGRAFGAPAWLVYGDMMASSIRRKTDGQFFRMIENSIRVPEARGRLEALRRQYGRALVAKTLRGLCFEDVVSGVHHDTMGSHLVDRLEQFLTDGLPSRRTATKVLQQAPSEPGTTQDEEAGTASPDSPNLGSGIEEVARILDRLSSRHREVYMRWRYWGQRQGDIAQELGLSQPTVSRLCKAARAMIEDAYR